MLTAVPVDELGVAEHGWLSAKYHFSFTDYSDSARMGLGPLRVWNDDLIRAGGGFPMHPHKDMEIMTYVRSGAVSHEDSLGNKGRIVAGDVQVMTAGTGIVHSEYNLEDTDTTLFQIWVYPDQRGHAPKWETRKFPAAEREARLNVLASGRMEDRETGALPIHQDAALLAATLKSGQKVVHILPNGRAAYLVPAHGTLVVNGIRVSERAGVTAIEEGALSVEAIDEAEIVIVDVPYPWDIRSVINEPS